MLCRVQFYSFDSLVTLLWQSIHTIKILVIFFFLVYRHYIASVKCPAVLYTEQSLPSVGKLLKYSSAKSLKPKMLPRFVSQFSQIRLSCEVI